MGKDEIKKAIQKAKDLLFDDPEVKEKWLDATHISSVKDFFKTPRLLSWLGKRVVFAVEVVQKEYNLIEPDERVDVAAELLDDLIHFKGWSSFLELVDDKLFRFGINILVDWINEQWGNDWSGHVLGDL